MTDPEPSENLAAKRCKPCEGGIPPMNEGEIRDFLSKLTGWKYVRPWKGSSGQGRDGEIVKTFTFKNFRHTMAFVNAVANIADEEDHHPDMEVGYKTCKVRYSTHAIKGISENDFICAAKIEALLG
ncbi:MAG TPA: 4a-hydroxytetrahydrobiopterin dehydratase [bacterium]|nr:4a-hydroxytetrahydrobiopterin dehydratase [bacterium]